MRYIFPVLATLLAALSSAAVPVAAQNRSGAKEIIAEHCIECHRVPGFLEEARVPDIIAPDFQAIADDPKTYTTQRLVRFLQDPHFPMRRAALSESEIQRIIGFISDLRSDRNRVD